MIKDGSKMPYKHNSNFILIKYWVCQTFESYLLEMEGVYRFYFKEQQQCNKIWIEIFI